MRRTLMAAVLAALPFAAHAQTEQQQIVDRSTLAVQEMVNDHDGTQAQSVLRRARAVMICPRVFQAGFLLGGQGGSCVLVARGGGGSWSSPAFYGLAGGNIGFLAGVQDAEVMLMIMNDKGLRAIMDDQFKLGANAQATFVDFGGGVEGATTAALRADIVGFSRARGLYAGISLGGSFLSSRSESNQLYYGKPVGPTQIVITMEANNPAADPLRAILMRYGAQDKPAAAPALPAPVPMASAGAPMPINGLPPQGAVQQQALPPPGRK